MENLESKYDPKQVETQRYAQWEEAGYFKADPESGEGEFSIVIPPPNVTGILHIGHALNGTIQDILTRWQRMRGKSTLWLPGIDHAGIATQHVVARNLRKEGIDPDEIGREEFVAKIWEWKEHHGSTIIHQFKTLGCSCDWSRERFTMDEGLSRAVRLVFKTLYDDGLIYRGDYMVNWSPKLQTALSDDEVEKREVDGNLWHFKYPFADGSGHAVVATTRPETMLGDTAVAVNPTDERYTHLIGKTCMLPLQNREIPIIADEFVDKEFGTGMVKVTPAHDPNDYEIGRRHDLEFINILNTDGTLNENAGAYAGLSVEEGRKQVVKAMEAEGLLEKIEPIRHTVGHCYRSGCVIEPFISKQWFVKMRPLAEPAIAAVREGRTRFVPPEWDKTYFHWLENVRDWCISRQLVWGHRIPVFTCEACGEEICEVDTDTPECGRCGGVMTQDPDVLDTWFSSQLWPFSTMGWPDQTADLQRYYPTSVLVTAHDIIFFWVARMIMIGLRFMDDVPFREVYITPLIMAEGGGKMSKSKGNAVDPLVIAEDYGADTVRLTLASYAAQARTVALSMKRFEGYRNFTNKLWNAARFVFMNVEDVTPEQFAAGWTPDALELEDRWILSELRKINESTEAALGAYKFDEYMAGLYDFAWKEYCDWYLELVKPRLYAVQKDGYDEKAQASRQTAQVVLLSVLEHLLRLLHPVAPFITEEIWQRFRDNWGSGAADAKNDSAASLQAPSLVVAPWPEASSAGEPDEEATEQIQLLQDVIYQARKIRGEMNIPPGTATELEVVAPDGGQREVLSRSETYFRALLNLSELRLVEAPTDLPFASTAISGDITIRIPLPDELRQREAERLAKDIAKIEADIARIEGKLTNEKFVAKAPEAVVDRERARLAEQQAQKDELASKLASLG